MCHDSIGTCSDTIAHVSLLCITCLILPSILALNGMSFSWNIQQKTIHACFQCSLTIADTIMAVYISIIIISNHIYSGNVIFIVFFWKDTVLCIIAGVVFMTSVLASNISTLLISFDRCLCMVIRGPFATRGFSTRKIILFICLGWCTAITLPTLASTHSLSTLNTLSTCY